ncbi:hypothetical protein ACHAWF_018475 [Thalassiosira exigua]
MNEWRLPLLLRLVLRFTGRFAGIDQSPCFTRAAAALRHRHRRIGPSHRQPAPARLVHRPRQRHVLLELPDGLHPVLQRDGPPLLPREHVPDGPRELPRVAPRRLDVERSVADAISLLLGGARFASVGFAVAIAFAVSVVRGRGGLSVGVVDSPGLLVLGRDDGVVPLEQSLLLPVLGVFVVPIGRRRRGLGFGAFGGGGEGGRVPLPLSSRTRCVIAVAADGRPRPKPRAARCRSPLPLFLVASMVGNCAGASAAGSSPSGRFLNGKAAAAIRVVAFLRRRCAASAAPLLTPPSLPGGRRILAGQSGGDPTANEGAGIRIHRVGGSATREPIDSPDETMSPYPAIRRNGTCTGSLWKSHSRWSSPSHPPSGDDAAASSSSPGTPPSRGGGRRPPPPPSPGSRMEGILAEANERQRAHEFCVLVGNALWSYSDVWAYSKGDAPTSEIRIVGASAWNPPSVSARIVGRSMSPTPSSPPYDAGLPTLSSEAVSSPSLLSSKSADFLIVTYSGTHVRCSAPTPSDKDEWLAALHAGLEGNIMENRVETLMVLSKLPNERTADFLREALGGSGGGDGRGWRTGTRESCRELRSLRDSDMMVQSAIAGAMTAFEAEMSFRPFVPPHPRSSARPDRRNQSAYYDEGNAASGVAMDPATGLPPTTGYRSPCDDWSKPPSDVHCTACGRYPPEHAMRIDAAPLPEYGMEVRVDLCHDCAIAQGLLRHVRYLGGLYEVEARDRAAIRTAWGEVKEVLDRLEWENAELNGNVGAIVDLVRTEQFVTYRQTSSTLDSLCEMLETRGLECASDFVESVEECAQAAESCIYSEEQELVDKSGKVTVRPKEAISLKKEAFKVAGDMCAALKLLYEYALPPERRLYHKSHHGNFRLWDNADMLAAILEFFLDLCDEGQVEAVAFFWPQLCHIHMQMLPPKDAEEMIRVELMEDFLLTVSTRYSVHLALDLVWGLTADLEESLGPSNCNALGRRRRFAILRFVSELESLLFDFDGGWGGGGVSLHGMLSPSQHQAGLLRDAMSLLQLRRRFGSHSLTRSVRLDKLRAEALESLDFPTDRAEASATRARIAKNAAYFSSHISFVRKLGNVAEKLRFMEPGLRAGALQNELKEINASGKILGGDPLNRLCGDGRFQRTVQIPVNEGHVFRSKERTPVLLLTESIKDAPETANDTSASTADQQCTSITEKDLPEQNNDLVSNGIGVLPDQLLCNEDQLFQESTSTSSQKDSSCIQDDGENGSLSCPESCHQSFSNDPPESPGRLSHGLLTLTPKLSDATYVTEEGKEMMADMIATLVDNQKINFALPLDDSPAADNIDIDQGVTRQPHQLTDMDSKRLQQKAAIESVVPPPTPPATRASSTAQISSVGKREDGRKISALGSVFSPVDFSKTSGIHLTADGQFRRDVLLAIMERGMRGSNIISKGAATTARRAIQAMDRKRAITLMNDARKDSDDFDHHVSRSREGSVESIPGLEGGNGSHIINADIDEDEVMEALRLLILQNQAAQENLSSVSSVDTEAEVDGNSDMHRHRRKGVDAGEVDRRLAGCGQISSSILSALRLWKGGIVSNGELLELIQKDLQFLKQSAAFGSSNENKLIEDSAFWGRFSFGERWAEKKARLAASSRHGSLPGWDLTGCIVKSNDDLRQEAFVMQLIGLCEEAFQTAGLDLWVHPYHIVATGLSTGIIECVRNAMSFDSLKKRPGYGTDGLAGHFQRMTEIAADPTQALNEAKENFVRSLAAYSLMSYLFLFKDRHNGNLLLDTAGHVIHIDFGFVFGIAPGGSFSLEQSTPFKLTEEMLEVMGGLGSPLFSEFVTLFCCGFLALQAHSDTFLTVVEVTCRGSNFHCFDGKDPDEVVSKLRERLCPELNKSQTVAFALDLIKFATTSYGTKQYDYFQYLSQGIAT